MPAKAGIQRGCRADSRFRVDPGLRWGDGYIAKGPLLDRRVADQKAIML